MTSRSGFALLATLWLIVALSAACVALTTSGRDFRLAAMNIKSESAARRAAEAGAFTAASLLDAKLWERTEDGTPLVDPWRDAGTHSEWVRVGAESEYRIMMSDVNSRLNLNQSGSQPLERLLLQLGVPSAHSATLAERIVDWRDADTTEPSGRVEAHSYTAAASLREPANRPFEHTGELAWIPGLSPEVLRRIEPLVTTVGDGRINLHTAPPAVLATLPGMIPESISTIVRLRSDGRMALGIDDLSIHLSEAASDSLAAHLPELVERTLGETRAVEVVVLGRSTSAGILATRHILFEQVAGRARAVWRRAE